MKKAYLLVFSNNLGTMAEIKDCLNSIDEIITWRTDLPNAFYLISESSAAELSKFIRENRGEKARFIVVEIGSNKQGWLPYETWYLLKYKKKKPKTE